MKLKTPSLRFQMANLLSNALSNCRWDYNHAKLETHSSTLNSIYNNLYPVKETTTFTDVAH